MAASTRFQKRHGESKPGSMSLTYRRWCNMIRRVDNRADYEGVTIAAGWRTYENFKRDMGECPSPAHTLDRKDNTKGYEPGNCRWATAKTQANNRTNNTRVKLADGREMTAAAWCDLNSIPPTKRYNVYRRMKRGVSPEQAIK